MSEATEKQVAINMRRWIFAAAMEAVNADLAATEKSKGWEPRSFGENVALFHSELSEALEEYRNGHTVTGIYYNGDKPEGIPIELADCMIRIMSFCGINGIDLGTAISIKAAYNETREQRHGGKLL